MVKKIVYIASLLIFLSIPLLSQEVSRDNFVQVSGIILDEFYNPVGGITIISQKLRRVAVSEVTGIYSLTSVPGDTIMFRSVGFKRYHSVIPMDYPDRTCTIDIVLETDTVEIEEVTILPWRTYNEFLADMVKEPEVDPVIEYMNENIESIYVAINQTGDINSISAQNAYRTAMQQNYNMMRYRNQIPVNNLLNPFAWAKFINSAKNGLFRNESALKPRPAKVVEPQKTKRTRNN